MCDLLEEISGARGFRERRALGEALEDLGFDARVIDADRSRQSDRRGGKEDEDP